jgi:hypothetical protein
MLAKSGAETIISLFSDSQLSESIGDSATRKFYEDLCEQVTGSRLVDPNINHFQFNESTGSFSFTLLSKSTSKLITDSVAIKYDADKKILYGENIKANDKDMVDAFIKSIIHVWEINQTPIQHRVIKLTSGFNAEYRLAFIKAARVNGITIEPFCAKKTRSTFHSTKQVALQANEVADDEKNQPKI